jgi:hypothetical protein
MWRVKNLSFGYAARGSYSFTMQSGHWNKLRTQNVLAFKGKTQTQRLRFTHNCVKEAEKHEWDLTGEKLAVCCTALEQLELDFSNATCPYSCCSNFNMQLQYLRELQPKVIMVLMLMDEEEEKVKKLIFDVMTPQGGRQPQRA